MQSSSSSSSGAAAATASAPFSTSGGAAAVASAASAGTRGSGGTPRTTSSLSRVASALALHHMVPVTAAGVATALSPSGAAAGNNVAPGAPMMMFYPSGGSLAAAGAPLVFMQQEQQHYQPQLHQLYQAQPMLQGVARSSSTGGGGNNNNNNNNSANQSYIYRGSSINSSLSSASASALSSTAAAGCYPYTSSSSVSAAVPGIIPGLMDEEEQQQQQQSYPADQAHQAWGTTRGSHHFTSAVADPHYAPASSSSSFSSSTFSSSSFAFAASLPLNGTHTAQNSGSRGSLGLGMGGEHAAPTTLGSEYSRAPAHLNNSGSSGSLGETTPIAVDVAVAAPPAVPTFNFSDLHQTDSLMRPHGSVTPPTGHAGHSSQPNLAMSPSLWMPSYSTVAGAAATVAAAADVLRGEPPMRVGSEGVLFTAGIGAPSAGDHGQHVLARPSPRASPMSSGMMMIPSSSSPMEPLLSYGEQQQYLQGGGGGMASSLRGGGGSGGSLGSASAPLSSLAVPTAFPSTRATLMTLVFSAPTADPTAPAPGPAAHSALPGLRSPAVHGVSSASPAITAVALAHLTAAASGATRPPFHPAAVIAAAVGSHNDSDSNIHLDQSSMHLQHQHQQLEQATRHPGGSHADTIVSLLDDTSAPTSAHLGGASRGSSNSSSGGSTVSYAVASTVFSTGSSSRCSDDGASGNSTTCGECGVGGECAASLPPPPLSHLAVVTGRAGMEDDLVARTPATATAAAMIVSLQQQLQQQQPVRDSNSHDAFAVAVQLHELQQQQQQQQPAAPLPNRSPLSREPMGSAADFEDRHLLPSPTGGSLRRPSLGATAVGVASSSSVVRSSSILAVLRGQGPLSGGTSGSSTAGSGGGVSIHRSSSAGSFLASCSYP